MLKTIVNYINNIPLFLSLKEGKEESDGGTRWGRNGPTAVGGLRIRCRVVWTPNGSDVPGAGFY